MEKSSTTYRLLSGIFLISGTMIGAGMLGIPLVTYQAGFVPAVFITSIVWLFMYFTGRLYLEATLWMPDGSNILSITENILGKTWSNLSGFFFVFLYYCLMIAYFSAGSLILADIFYSMGITIKIFFAYLLFGSIFFLVVLVGPKSINRVNIMFSCAMIGTFLALVFQNSENIVVGNLKDARWLKMSSSLPILFSAFGFHNIIPSMSSYLKRDKALINRAIFWGSIIPLIIYVIWQGIIFGFFSAAQMEQSIYSGGALMDFFQENNFQKGSSKLIVAFSFFAIITSVLGVSFSLVDFVGDGLGIKNRNGLQRLLLTVITFVPPFTFAYLNKNIFLSALGVAGGYGEAFLNGLLPIALVAIGSRTMKLSAGPNWFSSKFFLFLLFIFSIYVIIIESLDLFKFFI